MSGLHVACFAAAAVCWVGAVGALCLPGRQVSPAIAAEDHFELIPGAQNDIVD